jgi:hypothetical membrane protein
VGGWLLAGSRAEGYSPLHDHISELARVGAPTRVLMTAGFVGFGLLAPVWARTLGRSLGSDAVRTSVTAAGVTTLGVAALPLGATFGDGPHAVAAALGYASMAATPLLASRRLSGRARAASAATGLVSSALLLGTTLGRAPGALQRTGLGVVDAWFVVMAVRELRRASAD